MRKLFMAGMLAMAGLGIQGVASDPMGTDRMQSPYPIPSPKPYLELSQSPYPIPSPKPY